MPSLRKVSEHGLGHLLSPEDFGQVRPNLDLKAHENAGEGSRKTHWIEELWSYIVLTDGLGKHADEPAWLDRPAISRLAISSAAMRRPFKSYNKKKSYQEQVKPFNFMLSAHVAPLGHPAGADKNRFHLVGRYNPDSKQWLKMKWLDIYSGGKYSVTTSGTASKSVARIKTYRDVLDEYRTHPEAKSLGPDGEICDRNTAGLLARRPITVRSITYVGKESNRHEEVQAELIHDEDEVLNEYRDPRNDDFKNLVLPILGKIHASDIAKEIGKSERTVKRYRNMQTVPPPDIRNKLTGIAARHAREYLKSVGIEVQKDDYGVIYQYLDISGKK